ncbi:MAG: TonB-dependent receptor [Saprospiraceae bacterium]|nr:TonB-dependent receptor [Saprospiraceae bacterium]
MKKNLSLLLTIFCFATLVLAQSPGQTLRGMVTDADTGEPLVGASVQLPNTNPLIGATSSLSGSYLMEKLPVGRYQVKVSYIGHEPLVITEVLVESGRETVLNVQLRERADSLQTVVVKASSLSNSSDAPINRLNFSVEEQFRFPGTNFDPARLAMAYPGVAGENDGTNIISVRGNSPNALQWRLEGVEIVNPNHTANAGTFGDRPTGAGGGVNILSAQLLGGSSMLTGAFPAQYGNAIGGIMDMSFRKGNDQHHELIAQAGFIGIEAAVEGPVSVGGRQSAVGSQGAAIDESRIPNPESPSFLANYRYSFTGLLTAMGADFGDEETAFQDVAFHVALPGKKGGNLTLFGMGGKSSTLYRSPTDSATIEKELFNIDFQSKMGAAGLTYVKPLGKRSVWQTVAILSALEHVRTADFLANGARWEDDLMQERKASFASVFTQKIDGSNRIKIGVEAMNYRGEYESLFIRPTLQWQNGGSAEGWLVQPYFDWQMDFGRLELTAGIHASVYTVLRDEVLPEPRLSLSYQLGQGRLNLSYGLHSQLLPLQLNALKSKFQTAPPAVPRAHHIVAGYQNSLGKSLIFKAEAYYQHLLDQPVYETPNGTISLLNLMDFSQAYFNTTVGIVPDDFKSIGQGRNYGIDLSLQKYLTDRFFFLLAGSIYHSEYTDKAPKNQHSWRSTRFDGGYTMNLTGGREFLKQKSGKTIINGISSRAVWLGGFRETPILEHVSAEQGYTVFNLTDANILKLDDYIRLDLRFYKKWNKTGKNSMLSLDIQNLTNRKNIQYHYFDTVQGKILEKRQLGLIPIMTWRGEF